MDIINIGLVFNSNMDKRDINSIKRIILHHTGVSTLQSVDTIHNYHKNTKGYAGIGYHYYVRKDGSVFQGRPLEYIGAHAYGNNSDSIGICAEGNFNEEVMQEAQEKSLKELILDLLEKYNIVIIQGHKEVDETSCPGENYPLQVMKNLMSIYEELPDLQYQVHLQDIGWCNIQNAGEGAGTEGQARRLEAVRFFGHNGLEIKYRVHIGEVGWQEWKNAGEIAGTVGEAKRIEKIEIECNRMLKAEEHVENIGWLPVSTGTHIVIGTEGKSLRLEAFRINVV